MRDPSLLWLLRRSSLSSHNNADRLARSVSIVGAVLGIVSLILSWVAFHQSGIQYQAAEHQQFIRDTYATYLEMNRFQMQQPEMAHEFVRPGVDYRREIDLVKRAFAMLQPAEKTRRLLQEEAFAYYLFSTFERLAYEKRAHRSTRSRELDQFLERQLKYYGEVILPNPRLVYYWRDAHGCEYYDLATRRDYTNYVSSLEKLPSDWFGPFGSIADVAEPQFIGSASAQRANALRCFDPSHVPVPHTP